MSSKKPKQAPTDEWRPVRSHTILRRFKRGPDKVKRFVGQQDDEKIRRVVREHPLFYARSGLPLLLALALFGFFLWLETKSIIPASSLPFLDVIASLAIIGTGLYCAYRIFELWWVNVDIVTDKRVLTYRGLLSATKQETTLDKVQQVAVDQETLLGILLSYGTVYVYLAGGKQLILKNVPDPKGVRDDIQGITQSYKAAKAPSGPPPMPTDQTVVAALDKLGKNQPLPILPNADKKYEHLHSPSKLRGPLRRFGGPLRIECDVHYDAEEYTVMYIQRSIWVLVVRLILPILLALVTLIGALIARVLFGLFAIAFVIILIVIGLVIIGYLDDVFILTNKRIIDINRKLIILSEQHDTTTYDKISKIEVKSSNVIQLALSIGNLYIETQGNNPNIHMRHIAHPFFVQDKIYEIKGFKEKFDKVKGANERKTELTTWFGTVLSVLESKVSSRGVPNLQTLDLWDAIARASQFGMKVVPIGESANYPHVGSGKIVMQIPPPGTLMEIGTDEKPQIQVVLSKRQ